MTACAVASVVALPLAHPSADDEVAGRAELLDLGALDALRVERRAERAGLRGGRRGDLHHGAAGELDAVVEALHREEEQPRNEHRGGDAVGPLPHVDEVVVRVGEERHLADAQVIDRRITLQPQHVEGAGDEQRREQRRQDADDQGDGKALHRPGAELEEQERGDDRREARVGDGRERVLEALVDGEPDRLAVPQFLADALEDQHVRVDRDADGEHDAGEARQRERGVEHGQRAHGVQQVECERRDGEDAAQGVVAHHDQDDEQRADEPGEEAGPDRVGAEARAHLPRLHDHERDGERAGLERQGQVLGLLQGLAAEGDAAVALDAALDDRRAALHPAVEDDGHEVADVPAGALAELAATGAIELEADLRAVGERIELGARVHQVGAGDERLVFHHVERRARTRRRRSPCWRTT